MSCDQNPHKYKHKAQLSHQGRVHHMIFRKKQNPYLIHHILTTVNRDCTNKSLHLHGNYCSTWEQNRQK